MCLRLTLRTFMLQWVRVGQRVRNRWLSNETASEICTYLKGDNSTRNVFVYWFKAALLELYTDVNRLGMMLFTLPIMMINRVEDFAVDGMSSGVNAFTMRITPK